MVALMIIMVLIVFTFHNNVDNCVAGLPLLC